jgi:AAA domain/Bifunctional DNA primase/polymerase, N-terminal/Primase C terminal 1 (PriCT-1)
MLGPSKVAVVEYDTEQGGRRLLELFGGKPPSTPTCRTGSDRLHFYFLEPAGAEKVARDGIELRVGAHQCVVPPSIHPDTGKPYRWVRGREPWAAPLAAVPSSVLDYFAETQRNGGPAQPLPDLIPIGRIDDTLASLAGSMRRRNADERAIYAALVETLNRCEPGHTHTEADCRRIARSIAKKPGGEEPEPFVLEVVSARELCALPDPPEDEQLLGPLLLRGQRLVLGAHTGEGKTSMALQIVRALTTRGEFLDWQGSGGRVLVLDAEQGLRTVKRRLREVGLQESDDVDYVRVPDGLALDSDERHVAEVEQVLEQGNYVLVVADPLYKLHTGDSNDEREAVDLMRRFDGWRERFGFALLLPVHCRKPVPGLKFSIHDLFGSSAYVRGAEVVLGLRRVSDGYAKLHFLKDRDGDLPIGAAWGLLFDQEDGFRRDPNDGVVRDLREELLELLADGAWWTLAELRKPKDEGGIGADRDKIKAELEAMTDDVLEFELGPEGRRRDAKCWRLKCRETPDDTSDTYPETRLDGEAEGRSVVVSSPIRETPTDDTSTDTERGDTEVSWEGDDT